MSLKLFIRDSVFIASSQILNSLVLIAVQIYLARTLSLSEYGEISLALAFLNIVESIFVARSTEVTINLVGSSWGTNFSIAKSHEETQRIHEIYWCLGSFTLLVVFASILKNLLSINMIYLTLMASSILFQAGFGVSKGIFIVSGQLKNLSLLEIINSIFSLTLFVFLIFNFGAVGFIFGVPIAALFKNLLLTWYTKYIWPKGISSDKTITYGPSHLSIHSILRNIFLNISSQADIIILGLLNTKESLAVYKVAKTLANIPIRISYPIWASLRPKMIHAVTNGSFSDLRRLLLVPAIFFLLTMIPIVFLAFIIFDPFVLQTYGKKYLIALYPFIALIIGSWIYNAVTGWMSFMLIISPQKKIMSSFVGIFAFLIVLVSFCFHENLTYFSIAISLTTVLMSLISWVILFSHR